MTSPALVLPTTSIMADKKLSGLPPPSLSSPSHQNGRIGAAVPKSSSGPHQNGSLDPGPVHHSPSNTSPVPQPCSAPSGRTSVSTSPLRTLGGFVAPVSSSGPEGNCGSTRPRGQSLGSALSSRTRTTPSRSKVTLTCCNHKTIFFQNHKVKVFKHVSAEFNQQNICR